MILEIITENDIKFLEALKDGLNILWIFIKFMWTVPPLKIMMIMFIITTVISIIKRIKNKKQW